MSRSATLTVGVQRRAPAVFVLAVSVLVAVLSLSQIPLDDAVLKGNTFAPSLVAVLWLGCFLGGNLLAFRTPYVYASAYIVCLFVFHFGLFIQDGFGLIRIGQWEGPLGAWAVRAGWYTNLAMGCVGIGFAARCLRKGPRAVPPPPEVVGAVARQNRAWLYHLSLGLLAASALLLAMTIVMQGNILGLTRMALFFRAADPRFIGVFQMLAPSAALGLALSAQTARQKMLALVMVFGVIGFMLLLGQRSNAMFPLVGGAVAWVKVGRRINPLVAAAAIVGTLLAIPVIGYLRTLGTYSDIASSEAIAKASERAEISAAFREMGGSIGPLIYTIKLIPAEEPYRLGRTYLAYAGFLIPNVGLEADRSLSRAAARLTARPTKEALLDMLPGDWATYHIIPDQFQKGGGAGFSGVAEPYFDFGLPGLIVFFVGLGVFLAVLDSQPLLLRPGWLLFGTLIFWHLLPTVRNGFGSFVKPAAFTIIALGLWTLFDRFIRNKRVRSATIPRRTGVGRTLSSQRG